MAEIDSGTLIVAIQAVETTIRLQEKMLTAEVLGDRHETEEFMFSLENAKAKLRSAYLGAQTKATNLPSYESLLEIRLN